MKVCFYSGIFARFGGIEEFTKDLALTLRAAGVEVRLLCASFRNPVLEELREAGCEIIAVPVYWGCRWNLPDYALLPWAMTNMRDVDVVIHQKPFKPSFYRFLSKKTKHIFLTAYHPADQFYDAEQARIFFSFFDAVFTQAEAFKTNLVDRSISIPVHVLPLIPPAVLTAATQRSRPAGSIRIAMMGRLEEQKNPQYALDIVQAMECDPARFPATEFNIYGSGALWPQLEKKATKMESKVIFHGRYDRDAVPKIVAENDLFLITSVSEGQCIVALEILANGRPLFATPIGALPEILRDSRRGHLLPIDNAPEAAHCIARWLAEHEGMSAQEIQQSYRASFDREKIKSRYVELIQQVGAAS
jgi:glycosyltransferase involved in cell wall biosynthesis